MKFIDKLERKFGKYAIEGLVRYLVLANLAVFLLIMLLPIGNELLNLLYLNPYEVLENFQIWRLVTFLFIPGTFSPILVFFTLYMMYFLGESLEMYWGSFRLNLYYLIGIIATIAVSLIFKVPIVSAFYVNTSIFLAFAFINPDLEFLIFFIIPVKVKYLAYLDWAIIAINVITGSLPIKLAALASCLAFFIFFGPDIIKTAKGNKKTKQNRQRFEASLPKFEGSATMHKCEECGITEKDDPNMEFRYCSKCSGLHEYCINHIKNHEHIK